VTAGQDAVHGARHLIGDVQRFGLLSAAMVVDRYIQIVDRAISGSPLASPRLSRDERDADWLVDRAARMTETSLRLLDTTAALIMNRAGQDDGAAPLMERLVLPPTRSGSSSDVSLWVHNPTPASTAAIDFHVTSLVCAGNLSIPVDAMSLRPERVDLVEAGGSREVRVRIEVPADQPAGHYHGLVLNSVAPSESIALCLEVQAPGEGRP
jgi:hypothetical protein